MIYINPYLSVPINTIIGGVAGTISSKSALATKLAISESIITRFQIVGSDVHARINNSYSIPLSAFLNDSTLTFYNDLGGKVTGLGADAIRNTGITSVNFPSLIDGGLNGLGYNNSLTTVTLPITRYIKTLRTCSNLIHIYLTNLIEIAPSLGDPPREAADRQDGFEGLTSCELIDMRKLRYYGPVTSGNSASASGFANLKTGCEIRVHIALRTINSGNVHPALNWVKNNRSAIVKFYDDNGNYVSTL